ncbi:MAG: glutamate--tRNA ligase [Clostridiales bacterium]|nr:glutamate--tRNA ligase [Clostridiales bacterium]
MSETDFNALAELLYPDIDKTPEDYEKIYPERQLKEGAKVTRFAPSPTGYIHIGNLFTAMISKLAAEVSGGVFFLRIEDTDKKREVENGVSAILLGLSQYGIVPMEGMTGEDSEKGAYSPYKQSLRKEIYACFAKDLVRKGLAYPCFCTEEELNEMREKQVQAGVNTGYYGEWAKCRNLSFEEQKSLIESGRPFVLRLRSQGNPENYIKTEDMLRGRMEMPENNMDVVLIKSDGIPPYAFAHAVDDHLMRTNLVVRSDEWIASLPAHLEIFKALGFKPPKYAHISPIMKLDEGNKRKLSKRKDPEAAVSYYSQLGYPKASVLEYLMTLANSNFEDWRRANPDAPLSAFPFNIKKMSQSGALFDLLKLNDVSKNVISKMPAEEVASLVLQWSREYDPELYSIIKDDEKYLTSIFSIDRGGKKPRKDIAMWSEVKDYISYFYDSLFKPDYNLPENIRPEDAKAICKAYVKVFDATDDKDTWFNKIKGICPELGFCPDVKAYKADPAGYKGHVGDVASVIRLAVTGRLNTPDLHSILSLLGQERAVNRLNSFSESI